MKNNKNFGTKRTVYKLINPHKYLGDPDNVIYRSSWELNAFRFCDGNPSVIAWGSEEIIIDYLKPIFNYNGTITYKKARYFPDLYVEYVNKNGEFIKELIEIKPKKQTRASKAKKYTTNLFENMAYAVNVAKWDAAKKWCAVNGVKFSIVTEHSIFK